MTAEAAEHEGAGHRERFDFQAEVARLLHIMVHSVYSRKEVFLRELISNASDACDKLRYEAVTRPELTDGGDFRILLSADPESRTLTVADNGIGMDRQDLIDNLGTIARSGTARFAEALAAADRAGDAAPLIGQFGVGFYSAFMVAERVDVVSRKAGTGEAWLWSSDGAGAFTVEAADEAAAGALRGGCGTAVRLTLRADEDEFLGPERLARIVETYSNHISFPVELADRGGGEARRLNAAGALWTRPKTEISEEDYAEFFHHVGQSFGKPWAVIHYRAEGLSEYTALLFIPEHRPFDLFDPERAPALKLYVNRVFITDDAPLLPPWLRFVRGVVDSADMPLTVSREMLQNNPRVSAIRRGLTGRILSELKKAAADAAGYARFWEAFGPVLKEGLYEDDGRRAELLALTRFRSTGGDGLRSLSDYAAAMKAGQKAIYYLVADDPGQAAASPQLEGFRARGLEVLLLTDPVDGFWVMAADGFEGRPFQSVTMGAADLDAMPLEHKPSPSEAAGEDAPGDAAVGTLIAAFRQTLGDKVSDVRRSARLRESPVCLVAADGAPDLRMERILALQRGNGLGPRVLEINPSHPLIAALAKRAKDGVTPALEDAAHLLFDQARILEGEPVADPAAFARRMAAMLAKAV